MLNIIANQKASDEKQEQRFKNTLIQASKTTLETHIKENDKVIDSVKVNVAGNTKDIKTVQADVTTMKTDLANLQAKYDASQDLLYKTNAYLAELTKNISKLDSKYMRDEEEQMRCQLIIDGTKEQGPVRQKKKGTWY